MKKKKVLRYLYNDLGFPIILINAPMKQIFGEWVLDINLNSLQKEVLNALVHKPFFLTGKELRFIRKYFEMTTTSFGKLLGVTHPAVLKWENEQAKLNPTTENYLRLYVLDSLHAKDKEFRNLFREISIENLVNQRKDKTHDHPIEIDANDQLIAHA